jgi:hypothetical protein
MANLLNYLLSLDAWQLTALLSVVSLFAIFIIRQNNTVHYPDNLPRIRENGRTSFSLKTRLAYYIDCQNLFKEVYNTVRLHSPPSATNLI